MFWAENLPYFNTIFEANAKFLKNTAMTFLGFVSFEVKKQSKIFSITL